MKCDCHASPWLRLPSLDPVAGPGVGPAACARVSECPPEAKRPSVKLATVTWRPSPQIRAVAIAVIWRGGEILVYEGYNPTTQETFYRPLGGGIDFGEPAVDALGREFREEIGAGLEGIRYLDTLESIYIFDGYPGHELVRVYEARLADPLLYEREAWSFEEDGSTCNVLWKRLEDFRIDRLYPDGLLELLND